MISFLSENIGTITAAAGLIVIFSAIVVKMVKDKKKGRSSCGCNCAHCAMANSCHGKK